MKPSIAVSIYADHQETIQYPIGYIYSQLVWADEVWLFGGDETSTRLIEQGCAPLRSGSSIHNIDHKIVLPSDIASARNATQQFVLDRSECDWLVILSADTLPTPAAVDTIHRLITQRHFDPLHVPTHMVELYCDVGSSPYGCTLFHRNRAGRWDGDGSYFVGMVSGFDTTVPECLHLGYLGTDAVGRHIAQHALTWQSDVAIRRRELYTNNRREFVKETLLDIREKRVTAGAQPQRHISRLVFLDDLEFWEPRRFDGVPEHDLCHRVNAEYLSREYMKAIEAMGLSEDLQFVRSVANEIGRDYSGGIR